MSNNKNGVKNGYKTQFSSANQPSPRAKSRGWTRRKMAQAFMDKVFELQDMTIAEFEDYVKELEDNKDKYTVRDMMAKNYISMMTSSEKLLMDWIDRHIGKMKPEPEKEENPPFTGITINVMNEHEPFEEAMKKVQQNS